MYRPFLMIWEHPRPSCSTVTAPSSTSTSASSQKECLPAKSKHCSSEDR